MDVIARDPLKSLDWHYYLAFESELGRSTSLKGVKENGPNE